VSEGPVARLRAAALALGKAARAERIEANGPLGRWVEAQHHALMAQADAAEHQEQLVTHTLEGFHKVAKEKLAQCTELVQTARVTLATADRAKELAEVRAQQATSEMIERVAPLVVEGVREAVVIRERRYNRNVEMRRVLSYGGLALGLVLAGNIWRGSYYAADDGEVASRARVAIQHCRDTSKWVDPRNQATLCFLADFLPPEPAPVAPAPAPAPALAPAAGPTPDSAPGSLWDSRTWRFIHPGEPVKFRD
jgi:hypothetical protein